MTATLEPLKHRRRATFGWAEFLPRYLLVESAFRGRKVLEIGTQDPRSLTRFKEHGATKVVGTAPDPRVVDPTGTLESTGDLVAMKDGELRFADRTFDVVLVVDLGRQLAHAPHFVEEVRRVLSPGGFVLLGFESGGRGLSRIVDDAVPPPPFESKRLEMAVRSVFPDARFYQQKPFIGVAIQPEGTDGPDAVSLDPSLAASASRPSHVIALAGTGAPTSLDPTLVELPFLDFEATAQALHARSAADVERLVKALADARQQVAQREESLRAISERLPKLRKAFEQKIAALQGDGDLMAPTVIERPTEAITEVPIPLIDSGVDSDGPVAVNETHIDREPPAMVDADRLGSELSELRLALEAAELARGAAESQELEAHQRIRELEALAHDREREVAALAADLETQRSSERAVGADYRDAETRIATLMQNLEDLQIAHGAEVGRLEARISSLTERLGQAGGAESELAADLERLQNERDEARSGVDELRGELAVHQDAAHRLSIERDKAEVLLQERDRHVEHLERRIADLEQALSHASGAQRATAADRRAVELAATHMAKEVETLRERVQSLRQERDTLAATSQLLIAERDGDAQASVAGLAAAAAPEDDRQLQAVLQEVTMTAATTNQALIAAQRRCDELEATASDSLDEVGRALAAKASAEAQVVEAQRRAQAAQARSVTLQAEVAELGQRLASKEGELRQVRASVKVMQVGLTEKLGSDHAEPTEQSARVAELQEAVAQTRGEKAQLEIALSRTLEEAAEISGRLQTTEDALGEAQVALDRSESNRGRFAGAVESLRAELDEANADRDGALRSVETLRGEMQRIQRAWQHAAAEADRASGFVAQVVPADDVSVLRAQLNEAVDEVAFLRSVIADRDDALRGAQFEAHGLQDDLQAHELAAAEQNQVQGRLTDQVERLQQAVISLEGVAESRTAELSQAREALQMTEARSHDLIARQQNMESALEVARAERERAANELQQRTDSLAEANRQVAELTDRVRQLERDRQDVAEVAERLQRTEEERAALQRRMSEASDVQAGLHATARAADDRVAALTRQLSQADALARQARADALTARTERDDVADTLDGLRAVLAETRADMQRMRVGASIVDPVVFAPPARWQSDLARIDMLEDELARAKIRGEGTPQAPVPSPGADDDPAVDRLAVAQRADAQLSEAVAALDRTRAHLSDAEAHIGRLEDEVARLRAEGTRLSSRLGQLERTREEADVALAAADRSSEASAQRAAQANQALADAIESKETTERAFGELQAKHDAVRQALEEARAAVDSLRSERDALETERDALVGEIGSSAWANERAELKKRLQHLEDVHGELEKRAERAEQAREELAGRLAMAEADAQAATQQMAANAPDIDALHAELDRVRRARDSLAETLERVSAGAAESDEVAQLKTRVAALDLKAMQDDARVMSAEAESEMLQAQLKRAQAELARVGQTRPSAESGEDAAALRAQVAELHQEVARLEKTQENLALERHRLRSRLSGQEDERVQAERRIADLQGQLNDRDTRIERLNREIREKSERIRRLSGLSET